MIVIGERINGMFVDVRGAIQSLDPEPIRDLARRQQAAGADYLDVNVGPAADDPVVAMQWLVATIREVLGETDPSKARPGSVRREFGSNVMVNAAHASDSAANALREMSIIRVEEDTIRPLVEKYYGPVGSCAV